MTKQQDDTSKKTVNSDLTIYAVENTDYEGWIEALYTDKLQAEDHLAYILGTGFNCDWQVIKYGVNTDGLGSQPWIKE